MIRKRWTSEMDETLRAYYPKCSNAEISLRMGINLSAIESRARRLHLRKSEERIQAYRQQRLQQLQPFKYTHRYSCDHAYFSTIDTGEKAYWLGWLWSDGNMYERKSSYQIKLAIHKDDAYILEQFQSAIHADYPIFFERNAAVICISSRQMFFDIEKYGVIPRKSTLAEQPMFGEEFVADFVRGVFDGDGHISKNKYPQIVIIGTEAFCLWLQSVVQGAIGAKGTSSLKKNSTFRWTLSGRKNLAAFARWIYQSCQNGGEPPYLERKHRRFVEANLV